MNEQQIANEITRLARTDGIDACALVEADSGRVWQASDADGSGGGGGGEMAAVWEAAVDYWRVHSRMRGTFAVLGSLHVVLAFHSQGVLALLPCCADPDLLVVCVARHHHVDWKHVQGEVRAFGAALILARR